MFYQLIRNYLSVTLLSLLATACVDNVTASWTFGEGELTLSMTDASTDDFNAVYITVAKIEIHIVGDHWQTFSNPEKTVNLLDLVDGVREELGASQMGSGHYTQMRLILSNVPDQSLNILSEHHPFANYLIDEWNDYHELKIPSGYNTGVKIVENFTIEPKGTTELILDFDLSKSVIKPGNNGKWMLKPVVKILDTKHYAFITGQVTDANGYALEGAWVTAQVYDPSTPDLKDQVVIHTSTVSQTNGLFTLFIEPGEYNVEACKKGYYRTGRAVEVITNQSHTQDFQLQSAKTGTVFGDLFISGAGLEQHATLSFRQTVSYSGIPDPLVVEVQSIHVANYGAYSLDLPEGTYQVVASSNGKTTQEHVINVVTGVPVELDITL